MVAEWDYEQLQIQVAVVMVRNPPRARRVYTVYTEKSMKNNMANWMVVTSLFHARWCQNFKVNFIGRICAQTETIIVLVQTWRSGN